MGLALHGAAAAEARDIAFDVQLDPAASAALCDAVRIQQVVWNLVSNAVRFTRRADAGGAIPAFEAFNRTTDALQRNPNGKEEPNDASKALHQQA